MALKLEEKSVYLMIFNATMIARSVGKTFNGNDRKLKEWKKETFKEIKKLTGRMDEENLTEGDILSSIERLSSEFEISWGQAQKPINVILKYHFYLSDYRDKDIKKALHCPIDSKILGEAGRTNLTLTEMDKEEYLEIQKEIEEEEPIKIEFDEKWDEEKLKEWGLYGI